jgi:hypothetical protein
MTPHLSSDTPRASWDAEGPGPDPTREVGPLRGDEPNGRKKRKRRAMTESEARIIVAALQLTTTIAEVIVIIIR